MRAFTGQLKYADQAEWLASRGFAFTIDKVGMPLLDRRAMVTERRRESNPATAEAIAKIARVFSAPTPGCVYVVDEGSNVSPVKIGWSLSTAETLKFRVQQLQCGNPRRLRVLVHGPGSVSIELFIHRALRRARLSGEWFDRTPEVVSFIANAAAHGYREALERLART